MNVENIQTYLKECFEKDGIKKEDIIKKNTEDVKESFIEYINQLCFDTNFYEYSKDFFIKDDDEELEDIRKEMEFENISKEEIQELELVYDWFFMDRVRFFLKEDINFFLDLIDKTI